MSTFQLLLLIITAGVFYLFFKQLFSGNHPKRGVDFEAKVADEQLGGINRPDKTFSKPTVQPSRMEQLFTIADEAIEKEDYDEAKKALGSALIIEENNENALQKMAAISMQTEDYEEAKECYEKLLTLDKNDDMAHALLANAFFLPLAAKLKLYGDLESTQKNLIIQGILSIAQGDHPAVVQEKLASFLDPKGRLAIEEAQKKKKGK